MLSRLLDPRDGKPREPVFWLVVAAVVSTQLLAFFLLCTQQVRKAEARLAQVEAERMASNDCLQYMQQSTIASCATRTMGGPPAAPYAIR